MLFLTRLTLKQLICTCILVSLSIIIHIWYLYKMSGFMDDATRLTHQTDQSNFLQDPPESTKYVLFWNGYDGNINDQTIQCQRDRCVYKVKPKNKQVNETFFDVIIFNERTLNWSDIPGTRWDNQLYIFWCIKPSLTAPTCEVNNESFFNWTFTYHLDSTVPWKYFIVEDPINQAIVAPNKSVIWRENDEPLCPYVKSILSNKKKPIAWITSNCTMNHNSSLTMYYLQEQLKYLDLFIDMYGPCSNIDCTNNNCDEMVENDYYFYIAFEDDLAEDFVSSKVLGAYNNFAVPVVYGGANYNWFLPSGSYLDAKKLDPYALAVAIQQAVINSDVYATYFKWTHLYHIIGTDNLQEGNHPLCSLCAAL